MNTRLPVPDVRPTTSTPLTLSTTVSPVNTSMRPLSAPEVDTESAYAVVVVSSPSPPAVDVILKLSEKLEVTVVPRLSSSAARNSPDETDVALTVMLGAESAKITLPPRSTE